MQNWKEDLKELNKFEKEVANIQKIQIKIDNTSQALFQETQRIEKDFQIQLNNFKQLVEKSLKIRDDRIDKIEQNEKANQLKLMQMKQSINEAHQNIALRDEIQLQSQVIMEQGERFDEEFNRIYHKFHDCVDQNFTVDNLIGPYGEYKNLSKYIQAMEIDRNKSKEVAAEKERKLRETHKQDISTLSEEIATLK